MLTHLSAQGTTHTKHPCLSRAEKTAKGSELSNHKSISIGLLIHRVPGCRANLEGEVVECIKVNQIKGRGG